MRSHSDLTTSKESKIERNRRAGKQASMRGDTEVCICIGPRLKIGRGIKSEDDESRRAGSNDIRRGGSSPFGSSGGYKTAERAVPAWRIYDGEAEADEAGWTSGSTPSLRTEEWTKGKLKYLPDHIKNNRFPIPKSSCSE